MSNGIRFELSEWGDGTTRLVYWDSLTGDDIVYILNEDGTAARSMYQFADDDDETGVEVRTEVNLVDALRYIASNNVEDDGESGGGG